MKIITIHSKKEGNKVAYVDDLDFDDLAKSKWFLNSSGYAVRNKNSKIEYMHRLVASPTGNLCVDHKDHNPLNNTRENLRLATRADNSANMKHRAIGTSKFKGVSWFKRDSKWTVFIRHSGRIRKHIGYFDDEVEAAKAYDQAARELHGEFANLNFK